MLQLQWERSSCAILPSAEGKFILAAAVQKILNSQTNLSSWLEYIWYFHILGPKTASYTLVKQSFPSPVFYYLNYISPRLGGVSMGVFAGRPLAWD